MTDDRPMNGRIDRERDGETWATAPTVREKRIDRSRRSVLRAGTTLAGVLVLGGVTARTVGAVWETTGGSAITFGDPLYRRRVPFTVLGVNFSEDVPVSCHAEESRVTAENPAYDIVYDDGEDTQSLIGVRAKKALAVGAMYEFTTASPRVCKDVFTDSIPPVVKVAYKPVA